MARAKPSRPATKKKASAAPRVTRSSTPKATTKTKPKAASTSRAKAPKATSPRPKTSKATSAKATSAKAKASSRVKASASTAAPPTAVPPVRARPPRAVPARRGRTKPGGVEVAPVPDLATTPGDAIPEAIEPRLTLSARERMSRSLPVLEILEDEYPVGALRRFLDSIKGEATPQQAQIALGSAQLLLLPAREDRGGEDSRELIDLILRHWDDFGERRRGFHAQEFLRNALTAVGVDRERITRLEGLVPEHATTELLFSVASAHAVARDKVAMLRAVERALEAGASPHEFRRDRDFAPYANDPDLAVVLARAEVPAIPVDIEPYLPGVRAALHSLLATLKEFGESVELRPGVRLDAILDAERAGKVSLPNDYRALLTLTNGMRLWEHEFFSAGDYREHTRLKARAEHYLEASLGVTGPVECIPVASWGQADEWLLYDPRGKLRRGLGSGYVLQLVGDVIPVDDLPTAIAHIENLAREVLGTN